MLVIALGMNDGNTPPEIFKGLMNTMVSYYFKNKPDGAVVLVSSMLPNTQWKWRGNQSLFENELVSIAESRENVAVAKVTQMLTQFEKMGKKARDYLANNINHPNDFAIRVYAQVILKTILGDEFFAERYEEIPV